MGTGPPGLVDGGVSPCQRGFTPGLTAAEAIRLAKKHASAAEGGGAIVTLGTEAPPSSLDGLDRGFSVGGGGAVEGAASAVDAGALAAAVGGGVAGTSGRVSPGSVVGEGEFHLFL